MISIIVPVYNVEEYLMQCVDSLLCQTYKDIEILLIDDGSTDTSGDICDSLQAEHPTLIRVFHTTNGGVCAARNVGLKFANGEYVGFVDSDDWVEPEMFEVLLSNLLRHDAQLSICGIIRESDKRKLPLLKSDVEYTLNYPELMYAYLRCESISGYACNKLFITRLAKTTEFDIKLSVCEDIDFCIRYSQNISTATADNSQLYHYRQRLGSTTGELSYSPKILTLLQAYENILTIYQMKTPEFSYIIENYLLKQHLNIIGRLSISKINDVKLQRELRARINTLWNPVMHEKRNSIMDKINIYLTRLMPATMLRIKQSIIKRRYR